MIEPYDDDPRRVDSRAPLKITLHDAHASDTTEDSLARLVARQADAMKELREQRDDLKAALIEALSETGTNGTEPDFSVRPWIAKSRAIIKRTEAKKNAHP